jgi:D-alanyl-D-alanine carboxypeptidase
MPVAGVDSGTLIDRFAEEDFRGSIVAKTGTLYDTDGGVAALAGLACTNRFGPVVFAIYDMAEGRRVDHLRRIQDDFLRDSIIELGGPCRRPVDETRRETPAPIGRIVLAHRK